MNLKSVYLPDGVVYVGNQCFYNCAGLETATFGKGVASLGTDIFTKYKNTAAMSLSDLYLFSNALLGGGTGFDEALYATTTVHVPAAMVSEYQTAEGWSRFNIVAIDDYELTGITTLGRDQYSSNIPSYSLSGQRISGSAKGIYIRNGKKYIKH